MKLIYLLFLLKSSLISTAQKNDVAFGIYFGNDFRNDSVTIIANGMLIAQNIQLAATMYNLENLMIVQDQQTMSVRPYNKKEQLLKKSPA